MILEWGLLSVLASGAPAAATSLVHDPAPSVTFAGAARQASHLRLANEGDPGPLYECRAGGCAPATTDDPSRKNRSRMDFYVLPEGCVALRAAVLRPAEPGIDVDCGPEGSSTAYRCEAGGCAPLAPAGGDDGASTWPIPLPADCGGRIHELIVLGARSRSPIAYVECDASSGPARSSR